MTAAGPANAGVAIEALSHGYGEGERRLSNPRWNLDFHRAGPLYRDYRAERVRKDHVARHHVRHHSAPDRYRHDRRAAAR